MSERAAARKSPDAFRTIGEVAEAMGLPTHVLRFWESRFPQIRPVKGAGARRYYRPADVALITALRRLLHDDGLSIRAVQKMLREQGVRQVAAMAAPEVIETAQVQAPPRAPVEPMPAAPAAATQARPANPGGSDGKVVALPRRRAAPPATDAAQLCLPGFEPDAPDGAGGAASALPAESPRGLPSEAAPEPLPAVVAPDVAALYARLLALRDRMARAG